MHVLENEEAETEQVDGVAMETEQEQGEATQAPSEEADQARTNKDKHAAPQPDSFGNLFEQISGILSNFQGMFADKPEILAQVNEFASRILNVDGGQPQADVEGELEERRQCFICPSMLTCQCPLFDPAVKRHLEYWAAHIKQHLNNAQTGEGAPWWAKYANQWMAKYEAAQREASNAASEPTEPENGSSSTSALPGSFFDGERPFYPTRGGRSWGGPYGRGPWGPAWLHRGRSESPAPPMESFVPEQPQQTQPEASPEEIEEKVAQLNNMGFLGDDENLKEMLERYHGNVERVVELLVRG